MALAYPHTREGGTNGKNVKAEESKSKAVAAANSILESRGNAPRLFRNALAFLAADDTRLQDLEDGVRRYLAWQSILADRDSLDLPPHQVRQAESQRTAADSAVTARIGETYQWLLVPVQAYSTNQCGMAGYQIGWARASSRAGEQEDAQR